MTEPAFATGFLLRAVPHGDADLVTTWFTRELGKVSAFARAARGSKKRFGGAISQLTVARLQLTPTRTDLWRLESAEVAHSFVELAGDLMAVAYAAYAAELAQELTVAGHPEPAIYDDLMALHVALRAGELSPVGLRWYELRVLDVVGSLPDLGDLTQLLAAPALGDLAHAPGAALLQALLEAASLPQALALQASDEEGAAVRELLSGLIANVVDKPLQSLVFLQKMNAGLRRARTATARHPGDAT